MVGLAGALALMVSAHGRIAASRTVRRAEPVSAAAAAAVAAKAAGALQNLSSNNTNDEAIRGAAAIKHIHVADVQFASF